MSLVLTSPGRSASNAWQVDAGEFFDCFRFLLGGWGSEGLQMPASAAHGLAAERITHVGPSAGQTAVLILIDIVLAVEHRARERLTAGHA